MSKQIEEVFQKNRPSLSAGSLRTYTSIVRNLATQMELEFHKPSDILKHADAIQKHLADVPAKNRKTRLSALVVFIEKEKDAKETVDAFRKQMMADRKEADDGDSKQELTERQKEGKMEWAEVMKRYEDLKAEVAPLMKRSSLDGKQFAKVQMFVLLSCMLLIPPRRSLDWCAFKLRGIDEEKDNYLKVEKKKPYFVFNQYKTAKKSGQQKEEIPKELFQIITAWSKLNTHDWLLMNSKQSNPMNSTQITSAMYGFFGRPLSTSLLRHIYLSHKYADIPALQEMEATAAAMGHSVGEALRYVKTDLKSKAE